MSRRTQGFTLIELMIVVTLISILSAIAIPNFLQAKMVANELNAMTSLRTICEAQSVYRRTDWDGDGRFAYAVPDPSKTPPVTVGFPRLYAEGTNRIELISEPLAKSYLPGYDGASSFQPFQGYVFYDNLLFEMPSQTTPVADLNRFGAHAWPAGYNLTGRNSFCVDDKGVVWQVDVEVSDPTSPAHNYYWMFLPPTMKTLGWIVPN